MAYSKMTVADFKQRLKNGDYESATGARRGAGKADLTDDEKEQCRRAIDKHFGTEGAPAKAAPAAKKPKAVSKKVAKKATNGKVHKANGVAEQSEPPQKGPGRGRRKQRLGQTDNANVTSEDAALLRKIHLAQERMGTIAQAVEIMKKAKENYPQLDTQQAMTEAGVALTEIVQEIHQMQPGSPVDPKVMETLARTAPGAVGLPGQESPVVLPESDDVQLAQESAVS